MSEQVRSPRLLIADDDPRILDFYREVFNLPRSAEEIEADQEMDEMFSLLEGGDAVEQGVNSACEAVLVTQGLEALRVYAEQEAAEEPFDLALLDMRMPPGIDGLETARTLRERHPQLPIIFFTAYSDYKDEHIDEQIGKPFLLLRKPIDHEALRAAVNKMLPESINLT